MTQSLRIEDMAYEDVQAALANVESSLYDTAIPYSPQRTELLRDLQKRLHNRRWELRMQELATLGY